MGWSLVWRPGNWLFAVHPIFTWLPNITLPRPDERLFGAAIWWLWFEVSYIRPLKEPAS